MLKRLFGRRRAAEEAPLGTNQETVPLDHVCRRVSDSVLGFNLSYFNRFLGNGSPEEISKAYDLIWQVVRKIGSGVEFENYDAIGGAFVSIAQARAKLGNVDGSISAWIDAAILYDRYSPRAQQLIDRAVARAEGVLC